MKILYWRTNLSQKLRKFLAFAGEVLSDPARWSARDKAFQGEGHYKEEDSCGRIIIEGITSGGQITIEEVVNNQGTSEVELGKVDCKVQTTGRVARQAVLALVILLPLVLLGGAALAFTQPKYTFAETGYGTAGLIDNVRHVVAGYERNIVSTALQSMKVSEHLSLVPGVSVSTNDMACFPSTEHNLFPAYLDSRFSQFKYTVDNNGIVQLDVSAATTDAFLKRMKQLLYRLAEEE